MENGIRAQQIPSQMRASQVNTFAWAESEPGYFAHRSFSIHFDQRTDTCHSLAILHVRVYTNFRQFAKAFGMTSIIVIFNLLGCSLLTLSTGARVCRCIASVHALQFHYVLLRFRRRSSFEHLISALVDNNKNRTTVFIAAPFISVLNYRRIWAFGRRSAAQAKPNMSENFTFTQPENYSRKQSLIWYGRIA